MKIIVTIAFSLSTLLGLTQFQPQLTQHMYNPMPFNPAVVGYREAVSGTFSHRQLWSSFNGTPTTTTLGIHAPFAKDALGGGLLIEHDKLGISRSIGLSGQIAYRMRLGAGKLSFGLKAGIVNRLDMWSQIVTTQDGDDVFAIGDVQSWLPDLGGGVYYYQKKFYVGGSVPSFFSMKSTSEGGYGIKFDLRESNFIIHSGALIDLGEKLSIQPSALMKYQSSTEVQLDAAMMLNYQDRVGLGGALRPGNSWSIMLRLFATRQLALVYAYDKFFAAARSFDNGTHEITLNYDLIRYTNAPDTRFF